MQFIINWSTVTQDVLSKQPYFAAIQHYFGAWFHARNYGEDVAFCLVGFNCVGWVPGMPSPAVDLETGYLLRKKYTKARREIEIEVKLNHAAVMRTTTKEAALVVLRVAFQRVCQEMCTLKIPHFDAPALQAEWLAELAASDLLEKPIPQVHWHYQENAANYQALPQSAPAMAVPKFWQLISEATQVAPGAPAAQCTWLVQKLALLPDKQIIGFEVQLRKLLKKLYHFDALAIAKLVEGSVSDDSFLYFCCNLILLGQRVYQQVLRQPDRIEVDLTPGDTGEFLLGVADQAFELKLGSDTDKLLPYEYGHEIHDYNAPASAMAGRDWEVEDLPRRFPNLAARYSPTGIS